jgi:antitoxin VapB
LISLNTHFRRLDSAGDPDSAPPELPGSEALLRKERDRRIGEPLHRPTLLGLMATWAPLEEEFPEIDELEPAEDVDL